MARVAREKSSTGIYHIMLRGINRQSIFEDEEDRERFITTINFFEGYKIYAYCLMHNHAHILIQEVEDEIATVVRKICASYVFWYNSRYERCGHLFQERFKSEVVETDEYFLTVLRYVHQNPVKAGITKKVQDYKWSSYHKYINQSPTIDTEFGLSLFSSDFGKALDLFVEFHNEENDDKCLDYEDFIRLSDSEAMEKIFKLGVENISKLQQLDKKDRDAVLRRLKTVNGVSIRQLARITGISKSVIDRA